MTDVGPLRLPPRYREQCGTYAGWNQHQRFYEYPCQPCSKANVAHTRSWRIRSGRTKEIRIPISVLQRMLETNDTSALETFLPHEIRLAVLAWSPTKE